MDFQEHTVMVWIDFIRRKVESIEGIL